MLGHGRHSNSGRRPFALAIAAAIVAVAAASSGAAAPGASTARADDPPPLPRVSLYGDSIALEASKWVKAAITRSRAVQFADRTLPASSPCDWQQFATQEANTAPPASVIAEVFGTNMSKCQLDAKGKRAADGSSAYMSRYGQDLENFINIYQDTTTHIFLASAPAARNDISRNKVSHKKAMAALLARVASAHPNVTFVDAGASVETASGGYSRTLPCLPTEQCPNRPKKGFGYFRALDGLHFCPTVMNATMKSLRSCPQVPLGAIRYGEALAAGTVTLLNGQAK